MEIKGEKRVRIPFVAFALRFFQGPVALIVLVGFTGGGLWVISRPDAPPSGEVLNEVVDGFLAAGAQNDLIAASRYLYVGPDARRFRRMDLSEEFDVEAYLGYQEFSVVRSFSDYANAYLAGTIHYSGKPSRPFQVTLRKGEGGWGILRVYMSQE